MGDISEGMSGFESGNDSFESGAKGKSVKSFVIGCGDIRSASCLCEEGMFRSDSGVIESGRDGVGVFDLPFAILEKVGEISVKDGGRSFSDGSGMMF